MNQARANSIREVDKDKIYIPRLFGRNEDASENLNSEYNTLSITIIKKTYKIEKEMKEFINKIEKIEDEITSQFEEEVMKILEKLKLLYKERVGLFEQIFI